MLRKLEAVDLDGVIPSALVGGVDDDGLPEPIQESGDPATLWVDATYQRNVGASGLALIKRVAKGKWSWRKFKPPIVTEVLVEATDDDITRHDPVHVKRLVVIDGQHTAIMAVSRGLTSIPWLRIETPGLASQAEAFIGQNKDRTAISTMQSYVAALAASQEWALDIQKAARLAGARLVSWNKTTWEVGETLALGSIKTLVNRRMVSGAARVLRILVQAGLAPISADHIKAVDHLVFATEFKGHVKDEKLVQLLTGALGIKLMSEAGAFAATHRVPHWKGLTSVLYQNRSRVI